MRKSKYILVPYGDEMRNLADDSNYFYNFVFILHFPAEICVEAWLEAGLKSPLKYIFNENFLLFQNLNCIGKWAL